MVCIYCKKEKAGADFNREHVLPDSFGGFENSLVLHDIVCTDCNGYFGRELDLALARSSSEGLERYSWHVRPAKDVDRFRYGDVLVRLDAPDTDWDETLVRKVPTDVLGESRVELIPQAVFRTKDGGLRHVPLWDIRRGDWKDDDAIDLSSDIRVLAPGDLYDEVVVALLEHGIRFEAHGELPAPQEDDGELNVIHLFALTDVLRRAVAKIAFNYLAYTNGKELAQRPEFDEIRDFIRYGTPAGHRPVTVVPTTRLGIVGEDGEVPVVHYLILERDDTEKAVLAHITLFHWVVYKVVLISESPSDLEVTGSGHLFNLQDMTCHELARGRTNQAATE